MNAASALPEIIRIARAAGDAILEVYHTDFEVMKKDDGSSLTLADQRANSIIENGLKKLDASIPIVSEESARPPHEVSAQWSRYWLVDPLDGTREFTKRNGEFTVNIALIAGSRPVLGVVHVPVTGVTYYAEAETGAFKQVEDAPPEQIAVREYTGGKAVVVASRSHANPVLQQFFEQIESFETRSMGSSLKLCLVAEGEADVYPRLGPTSEWDTAAAQCVVEVAGGKVTDLHGTPLQYNKPDILNPWFVVTGAGDYPWLDKLDHVKQAPHRH